MLTTFGALAPVFLLIAFGWALQRLGFPGAAFWPGAERVVYWVMLPALLVLNTAAADLAGVRLGPTVAALVLAISAMAGLTLALKPRLGLDGPAFTSVFQAGIRCNVYVGFAAAAALYGAEGVAVMGLVAAVIVPTVNVYCVTVLLRFAGARAGPLALLGAVATNPLILACVAGFGLNLLGLSLPAVAASVLDLLGQGALALGVLCVGAALDFERLRRGRGAILVGSGLKLVALPVIAGAALWAFGIGGRVAEATVLFAALPIAPSGYVLARQLGGDAPLMAGMITFTTLAAVVTVPAVMALFE
jgi:malonate transporter and related proteins